MDTSQPAASDWNVAQRIAFRFFFCYFLLYISFLLLPVGSVKTQFPSPSPLDLSKTYGDLTPFSVLWNFMGYSTAYTFFAGAGEVLAAMLLFFSRTTTLGALVTAGVMLNVVMLDYSYDVPVKIESTHLLLMAVFLLAPDLGRLANMLILNRATMPADMGYVPASPRRRMAAIGLKVLLMILAVSVSTTDSLRDYRMNEEAQKFALYGIYDVEEFSLNGKALPPLATDPVRWKEAIFFSNTEVELKMMDDTSRYYLANYDSDKQTVTILTRRPRKSNILTYSQSDADHLVLEGPFGGDTISVKLKKVDETQWRLMKAKFHWVSQY